MNHNNNHTPPPAIPADVMTTTTLDEPVKVTLMRDLNNVYEKLRVVLLPPKTFKTSYAHLSIISLDSSLDEDNNQSNEVNSQTEDADEMLKKLRDWDLWGPLLICLSMSVVLSWNARGSEGAAVFSAVFLTVWLGAVLVTLNAQLLGGTISFFQSLCVLGYSVFPLNLAALCVRIVDLFLNLFLVNVAIVVVGFLWSTRASTVFIGGFISPGRRVLAVYPVFFFYIFLSWMILTL